MTSTISIVVVASITALLHKRINIDFKRTLLLEGAVANTAGLALSISSIPNIIIKTRVGLAFTDFLVYTLPLSLVLLGVVYFHTSRTVEDRTIEEIEIDPWDVIPNRSALYRSLAIFSAFLVLIATSGFLGISPIFIAMSLALAMFFLSSVDPDAVFKRINWSVIFFVGAFYIFIRGLELSGVLSLVSESVSVLVVPNAIAASIVIMWICAVVSALVDNIPVMLLLIPVVDQIVATMGLDPTPLYWALVIGGNLGGNITAFGSPAMLVSTETARKAGAEVGFAEFSRTVLPLTILLLLISSSYLTGLIAFNIL
jgi:Na+/H+ antiporter NhaD/arsenite permease-like protein